MTPPHLGLFLAATVVTGTAGNAFGFDHTHSTFTDVLSEHVRDGRVNYRKLKSDPAPLRRYLDGLATVTGGEFEAWPKDQQIAYLINLYNARTIGLILENFPLASIKQIGWLPGAAWRQEFIPLFGKTVSLGHVEHDLLRRNYQVPEIHFALVCAATGCPPLRPEAYRGQDLAKQLAAQGRTFLADTTKNRIDAKARRLHLSPIFKWYSQDFVASGQSIPAYVRTFLPPTTASTITDGYALSYTDYDWSLNDFSD